MPTNITDVYHYQTSFFIKNRTSISHFWSFLIFKLDIEKNENLYNKFARLHNALQTNKKLFGNGFTINISESMYLYHIDIIDAPIDILKYIIKRLRQFNDSYELENYKISFSIDKNIEKQVKIVYEDNIYKKDFLTQDDIDELENIIEKMQRYNYKLVYDKFQTTELHSYKSIFSHYANVISEYEDMTIIGNIIAEIAVILSLYEELCLENGQYIRTLLEGFMNNLTLWHKSIFIDKSAKSNFLNESFDADLKQLKIFLNLYDEEICKADLEDIFNF